MEENKWIAYEEFKQQLQKLNLTPEEYENRIKEYCEEYDI